MLKCSNPNCSCKEFYRQASGTATFTCTEYVDETGDCNDTDNYDYDNHDTEESYDERCTECDALAEYYEEGNMTWNK